MHHEYVSISSLVEWASSGYLQLPEIQRRYVWNGPRVRDYLDSLYRGYPSGTILVWHTPQELETKNLSVESNASSNYMGKRILLDGQQRITSLTAIIKGAPILRRDRRKPIEILFHLEHPEGPPEEIIEVEENAHEDLDDEEEDTRDNIDKLTFVVAGSKALKNNPYWISVSAIFVKSDREILKNLGIGLENDRWDKYSQRLTKVRDILKYQYEMQVLPAEMSYQEVTQIFVRVNSKGVKLRGHDLAVAQISANWRGFVDVIEKFAERFSGEDDYLIETGLIVRSLVVFATHKCRFDNIFRVGTKNLQDSFEECKRGLTYAIDFVLNNAEVGTLDYLSSPYLLIPIAVYAAQNNFSISKQDERRLLKWFYLAHMRGHYSGSTESLLDADLSSLFRTNSLVNLLDVLKGQLKKFEVEASDIAHKNKRSPYFSMLYFLMKRDKVKDWESGLIIGSNANKEYLKQHDHIFPTSLLKGKYDKGQINEIANIGFLTSTTNIRKGNKIPAKYFPEEVLPKWGIEALQSQLIPTDESLWRIENYHHFLEYRRKAIADYLNGFLKKLDEEESVPSISHSPDTSPYGITKTLENRLRFFIEDKLSSISDQWWIQKIPEDVRNNAEKRKQKNEKQWPWYSRDDQSRMAYLDFTDYLKIIIRSDNWKQIFEKVFRDKELISAKFRELSPIRNKIAHGRELTEQDLRRLRLHVDDISLSMNPVQSDRFLAPEYTDSFTTSGKVAKSVNKEITTWSEDYHLEKCDATIKDVYTDLKNSILSLFPNTFVKVNKYYIAFVNKKNFIYLRTRHSKLDVNLNLKKGELNDPKNIAIDMSKSLRHNPCEYLIPVDTQTDLRYILILIKQAYEKN
jgi:predicted transport protein